MGPSPDRSAERQWLALVFVGLLAAFLPTLWSLPLTWSQSYQEHGWVLAVLVILTLWRDRRSFEGERGEGLPSLLGPLGLSSIAWLLAAVTNFGGPEQAAFGL